jgi:transcriptional regulator with XRE-family HTH domain
MRQADLAERLGVKRNTISQYESGLRPGVAVLMRLYNMAPAQWKDTFREQTALDLVFHNKEAPELECPAVGELRSAEDIFRQFPEMAGSAVRGRFLRFADLVARVAQGGSLDDSVNDMLDDWAIFGDSRTAKAFREAAEYVRHRVAFLTGIYPDGKDQTEAVREYARAARRLAMALLRQSDIAEKEARQPRPKERRQKKS